MASGKIWNRRAAVVGGVGLAAGGYWALRGSPNSTHFTVPDRDDDVLPAAAAPVDEPSGANGGGLRPLRHCQRSAGRE